jgi:hypothetical protein
VKFYMTVDHICILWYVDPLLGGDREIGDYTAAVVR